MKMKKTQKPLMAPVELKPLFTNLVKAGCARITERRFSDNGGEMIVVEFGFEPGTTFGEMPFSYYVPKSITVRKPHKVKGRK